ncbi:trypsin-1-like [Cydia strobilella]|uniref:trypsin-1-like n=1 Tax=Cydia strobilella TaxID=1100964 RepID=UPI003003DFEE
MFKKLSSVIVLSFIYGVASQAPGDSCFQDGVPGVCKLLRNCQALTDNPKSQWWKLPRCGFEGFEVIICCVEKPTTTSARPVATTRRPGTTTTEFFVPVYDYSPNTAIVDGCAAVEPERTAAKTGRKAWDKCIDYQHELVYPCEQTALSGSMGRANRCNHNVDELIVGGTNAKRTEFPHMVLLGYGQSNGTAVWQCGGTLLSDRFILTAGHCTSARDLGPVAYAITGTLKRTDDVSASQVHRIRRIIKHPQYKAPSKYHDIALLEVENPIKLDFTTVPACLDVFGGDHSKAVATGWGAITWMGSNADYLQKVTLNKFKDEECSAKFRPSRNIRTGFDPDTQVCYGDYTQSKDTCQGDSGGPLTIQNRQIHCMYTVVGVTSFGKGCGNIGDPGMYTKVSHYVDWIESIVFA